MTYLLPLLSASLIASHPTLLTQEESFIHQEYSFQTTNPEPTLTTSSGGLVCPVPLSICPNHAGMGMEPGWGCLAKPESAENHSSYPTLEELAFPALPSCRNHHARMCAVSAFTMQDIPCDFTLPLPTSHHVPFFLGAFSSTIIPTLIFGISVLFSPPALREKQAWRITLNFEC